jgi:hypothetical protein
LTGLWLDSRAISTSSGTAPVHSRLQAQTSQQSMTAHFKHMIGICICRPRRRNLWSGRDGMPQDNSKLRRVWAIAHLRMPQLLRGVALHAHNAKYTHNYNIAAKAAAAVPSLAVPVRATTAAWRGSAMANISRLASAYVSVLPGVSAAAAAAAAAAAQQPVTPRCCTGEISCKACRAASSLHVASACHMQHTHSSRIFAPASLMCIIII